VTRDVTFFLLGIPIPTRAKLRGTASFAALRDVGKPVWMLKISFAICMQKNYLLAQQ
jgi:hypothetical protein